MSHQRDLSVISRDIEVGSHYILDPEPKSDCRLAVVSGGREQCSLTQEPYKIDPSFHGLELITWGSGTLELGRMAHVLVPGTLFYYGPSACPIIRSGRNKPLIRYYVALVGDGIQSLFQDAWSGATLIRVADVFRVQSRLEELCRLATQQKPNAAKLAALILEQLVIEAGEDRESDCTHDSASYQTYRRCRAHLQQHYLSLRSLSEFAAECHVTGTYLCRIFQRFEGRSPYQAMLRLKMVHAAAMLRDSGLSVKRTAIEVGFEDPYHFSKAFKRVFGVPPKDCARARTGAGNAPSCNLG